MNYQLTKCLSLLLGLSIIGSAAFSAEKAYAEEEKAGIELLAQLPSPVRQVKNPKAFTDECKIKLSPISGCQVVQYIIVNSCICEIVSGYKGMELNYRATKHPNESLVDSKRMKQTVNKPKSFSMQTSKGAKINGFVSEYTCGAKAASWEYNKTRYVLMTWSKINDNDLILLARRAAKADL